MYLEDVVELADERCRFFLILHSKKRIYFNDYYFRLVYSADIQARNKKLIMLNIQTTTENLINQRP
jgi:hypothetical protein